MSAFVCNDIPSHNSPNRHKFWFLHHASVLHELTDQTRLTYSSKNRSSGCAAQLLLMAADASDLLRSSDFGSSSEDEGVSNNNRPNNYQESSNATGLGQETAANLNSFEDSFNPNDSDVYAPVNARQAGFAKPRLPTTPAIIKNQGAGSSYGSKNKVMKDAAGFIKENGPRGVFDRDNAVVQDLSRSRDNGAGHDEQQDAYDVSEIIKSGEPSFERSESQSRVLEERKVNTLHNVNNANSRRVKANGVNTKQPATAVKQNLTLREQEKV